MKLSRRYEAIPPSGTMAVVQKAALLKRQGIDVVSFAAGEPDFDTPPAIVAAMAQAATSGETRYPAVLGLPALREAIAAKATRRYGVPFTGASAIVTPGAKFALWAAFQALVDPGDEVLVPTPCWVSYGPQIAMAQGVMVPVPCAPPDFELDLEAFERAITPRTVGLVLSLPMNPTGRLVARETLAKLAALALRHDLWIVSDDLYADLCWGQHDGRVSGAALFDAHPEVRDRVVIVDGPSKSHAMTGWRVGWALVPDALVASFSLLLGQIATGVTTFAQHGALQALTGDHAFLDAWNDAYRRRAHLVVDGLQALGLPTALPEGAFYALADVRSLIHPTAAHPTLADDVAIATQWLDHAHVAVVPGSAFHAPGFVRLSFACSEARIAEGLARLRHLIGNPP